MFDVGMPELIVIFIVALLVFGPKRLPELGKSLGQAMHKFKQASNEFKDSLEHEVGTEKIKEELLQQQKQLKDSLTEAALKPSEEAERQKEEAPKEYAG